MQPGCEHLEVPAEDGGGEEKCLHDMSERQQENLPHQGEDRKFKHDLGEALRDARLRMITRKDLREDAAKGIDKAASPTSDEIQTA